MYPHKAANVQIDRSQAMAVAKDFMAELGYQLETYHVSATMDYDDEAFIYLQRKYGFQTAQSMARYKIHHGLDFYWRIYWFKNLPRNAPQERFQVGVSGYGNVVNFQHEYPQSFQWIRPERARLLKVEASSIVYEYLSQQEIDLNRFEDEIYTCQELENRTDHIYQWRQRSESDQSFVELTIQVQGDEVGSFRITYRIPEQAAVSIKRQSGNEYFMDTVVSIAVLFFIGLISLVIFLKKYHEGEVEVRTAGILFLVIWISFICQALLRFRESATAITVDELSNDGVALFIVILMILIVRPLLSIFGITAWSVGESSGREKFSNKFTSLDSILNGKISTIHFARSTLQGYFIGFTGLGIIGALFWVALTFFKCTTTIGGYSGILALPLPFFMPVFIGVSGSLLSEMIFRLFGNLLIYKHLNVKWISVVITALFWAFFVPGFWGITLSLYPLLYEVVIWFIIGLFFGIVFWKYDLLTVIMANFLIMGVMQTLPLITCGANSLVIQGIISLALISLPAFLMISGFIKKERFSFKVDLTPAHIRRITERVRMSRELEIARQVQMRLLPKKSPVIAGFEISGVCIPAKEVGGDYFDFIELGGSKLGIVIGDVSGKGVPAAIYMTLTKGIVQSHVDDEVSPCDVLTKVNNLLYKTIDKNTFVSLFYAVLDVKKKTIRYSRAGHNPVIFFRSNDGSCLLLEPDGIALGLERGDLFKQIIKEKELTLGKGDLLVFYTDGFSEAMNRKKEEYGEDRLRDIIIQNHEKSVSDIYNAVLQDIKKFVKDSPQNDDMTVIFIKGK